ncbi:MAG: ATP-dependent DNA helicase PcrA [Ruminococcaceae bacterium]|nr:ATP-dependent DNA helicase PcrA [Oscillospiraceae bacterium]
MSENTLLSLRRQIIEKDFMRMNSMQFKAVTTVKGPLLILAGAGSGKTTVLVNRIINLIKYGNAYNSDRINTGFTENPEEMLKRYLDGDSSVYDEIASMLSTEAPEPWQILAITFTNKAANELKERLVNSLGEAGNEIWASTFHSACVRILRRYGDRIGYSSHFTIYDTDDSKRLIKECQRQLNIDDKFLPVKSIQGEISRSKDSLISPEEYQESAGADMRRNDVAKVFALYQKLLKEADAMDFDDIICNTVYLLKSDREVLEYYRNRFRYIMVDEYQDTNHAQYVLVSLLAGGHNNLCVVGDDDQSIYSFRGATIENILSFEEQFSDALVIRLEENYRSTQTILDAANAVIANNRERKGKKLWTGNGMGDKITLKACNDDINEGDFVAGTIMDIAEKSASFSDFAVLYRMNAQSNIIERALVKSGIPYRIIGGHRFYDRKEIKDALAYLAVVSNPNDNIRLRRIVNEPKRGIGETTMNNLFEISSRLGDSVFHLMEEADQYAALSRNASKLKLFARMIRTFALLRESNSIADLFRIIMNESGYIESLANDEKRDERIENLNELYSTIARYEEENAENATLEGFLEEVALLSDLDTADDSLEAVTLMTMHSAKGLEFPYVFIVGLENGVFPSMQSISEPSLMEEERRLAYVGITRAKKKLYITRAMSRMQFGKTSMNPPSKFISEIPLDLIDDISAPSWQSGRNSYRSSGSSYSGGYGKSYSDGYYSDDYDMPSTRRSSDGFKSYVQEASKPAEAAAATGRFKPGDTVMHRKFGKGLVVSAQPLGNDVFLEVAFDTVGTKKLMEGMARLEKI